MMKRHNGHFLLISSAFFLQMICAVCPLPGQTGDPWQPLAFLVGDWSGKGSGKPGDAIGGSTSFSTDLNGKIMVRKNRAELPAKPGEKSGMVHEDLMILYPKTGTSVFQADYFDNEGHVIDRKSTRLNSSHRTSGQPSRMPSSA
jgi:hypothetical protein